MKKALCSTAAATLVLFVLSGCADAAPVQVEDHPPRPTVEITMEPSTEPTGPVESEEISFSAGNTPPAQESTPDEGRGNQVKLELPAEPSPTPAPQMNQAPPAKPSATPAQQDALAPAPQETPPPAKGTIKFEVTTPKGAGKSPRPEPSAAPEPEPTPTPVPPVETPPPASTEPVFSIDHWLTYAQSYAKGVGLNLDPTATACWDNPIAAGVHCTCLERDLQSRLNRYGRDESITDVWIWAEPRSDGSYDLYIGYA